MPSPPPPTDQPPSQQQRTLNDTPVEVAVIGSGVCGVLAAAALRQRDGARVRVLEASPAGAGGVWRTTANHYSTLQAYAHLYEWDAQKRIDTNPWARAPAAAVLAAVQKYARETGVAAATTRGARVTAVTECFTSTAEEPKKESGNGSAAQGSGGGFFVDYELDVSVAAREQAERLRIGKKKKKKEKEGKDGQEDEEKEVEEEEKGVVEKRRLRASTVIVATGTLGRPMTPEERGLPSTAPFKGAVCYACRHGEEEWNEKNSSSSSSKPSPLAEGAPAVAGKKVVILGSGAFALEAAERAAYCGAESITIVCRPHEHWVVPFSRQLLFVLLVTVLIPRSLAYGLARFFARGFYRSAGIESLAPPLEGSGPQIFRGQCCDGWFFLQKAGLLRVTTEKVVEFVERGLVLEKGGEVEADLLVVALGHKLNWAPPFLACLPSNSNPSHSSSSSSSSPPSRAARDAARDAATPGTTLSDLHNFTFLGRRPRVATICDAVWFNVPHGPQAQIECFRSALAAVRAGPRAERLFAERALVASNWHGGTGEPLAPLWGASEADKRREAHIRSLAAGNGPFAELRARATLLSRRAILSVLLVFLALLEAARNAGWQRRGVERVLEANRKAREEFCGNGSGGGKGKSAAVTGLKKGGKSEEATASADVHIGSNGVGSGSAVVEGKKKA